jgi:fructose-1,6-bisphosphatase II
MHHPHAPPVYNGQMGPRRYMEKLAVGPRVNPHMVSLLYPIERNLRAVAGALEKPLGDVTAVILDRPRHADIIRECREAGVRIRLISDGDVGAAIEVAKEGTPVDILLGIGGTPEGVIAAAALKCMGGSMQGRLYPRNDEERAKAEEQGYDVTRVLYADDLCAGEQARRAAGRPAVPWQPAVGLG